jgi:hypothetical protein
VFPEKREEILRGREEKSTRMICISGYIQMNMMNEAL